MTALNSSVNRLSLDERKAQRFNPKRSTTQNFSQNRDNAYTAAGLPVPKRAEDLLPVLLAAEPSAYEIIENALDSVKTEKDLDKAIGAITRAQAVDALKAAMQKRSISLGAAMTPAKSAEVDTALSALRGFSEKTVGALREAAPALPQGQYFNMRAIIDQDASKQLKTVHNALLDLNAIASVLPSGARGDKDVADICSVISVRPVTPEMVYGIASKTVEDDDTEQRAMIRKLQKTLIDEGADHVILDVALGLYGPGVELSVVQSVSEWRSRIKAFDSAYQRQRVNPPETGRVSGMVVPKLPA